MSTLELSPDELTELLSGLTPVIPGYRVMRLIGRGGMSFVYLGLQEWLERQVAIKVIAPHALKDDISKARFEKEARTIAKLQHPCIVGQLLQPLLQLRISPPILEPLDRSQHGFNMTQRIRLASRLVFRLACW